MTDITENELSGNPLSIADQNLRLYGQMDPDFPIGYSLRIMESYIHLKPNTSSAIQGKLCIFSTVGDMNPGESFSKLWENK